MVGCEAGFDRSPGPSSDGELTAETKLLRLAIESMAQGLFMLDADRRITVLNQRFLELYRLPPDIIKIGATARDIVEQSAAKGNYPGITPEEAWTRADAQFSVMQPRRVEQRLGNGKTIAITFAPMPGGGWVTTHMDITERRDAADQLAFLAGHDALTGLANRRLVTETLTPDIETRSRFALLAIDLDGFKAINDDHGHSVGDEVLRQVAGRLTSTCPPGALVARMGGDEFLVRCGDEHPHAVAPRVAEAVIQSFRLPFRCSAATVGIGASVGVAYSPTDGETLDILMSNADLALYVAKDAGRGSCRIYSPDMSITLPERRQSDRRRLAF